MIRLLDKKIKLILIVIATLFITFNIFFTCKTYSIQKQTQMPISLFINGFNGYSGLAIPLGNAKEFSIPVCYEYIKR